jgi:hypothetical protein
MIQSTEGVPPTDTHLLVLRSTLEYISTDRISICRCIYYQVLNRLNEAMSVSTTELPQPAHILRQEGQRRAVTCLIVYDIPSPVKPVITSDVKPKYSHGPLSAGLPPGMAIGGSSNIGGTSDAFLLKDLSDNSYDDDDVQIIGLTPASPPKAVYEATVAAVTKMMSSSPGKDPTSDGGAVGDLGYPTEIVGKVVACIVLPCTDQYVTCVLPMSDGEHVFVATAPVAGDDRIASSWQQNGVATTDGGAPTASMMVYRVCYDGVTTTLSDNPDVTRVIDSPDDAVVSASLLPPDIGQSDDFDASDGCPLGAALVTTRSGRVEVVCLTDLSVLAVVPGDVYTGATYCSGVDRLCVSTVNSKLRFFSVVRPGGLLLEREHTDHVDSMAVCGSVVAGTNNESTGLTGLEAGLPSSEHKPGTVSFRMMRMCKIQHLYL